MPRKYNDFEINWLIENDKFYTVRRKLISAFEKKFNKKISKSRASDLIRGCRMPSSIEDKYTEEQVEWLRKNIAYHNNIQKAFNEKFGTNRSENYIRKLCFQFKIKRYEEQNKWLRENAKGRYLGDILTLFNEKFYPFEMKINTLFHRLENNDIEYKKWHVTEEDICWLKENAKGKKINEITEKYNNHFNKKATPELIGYLCKSHNIIRFNDEFGEDRNPNRRYGTYIFERVDKDNYRRKSNIMYEQYHNVVIDDEKYMVIHLDKDMNNFDKDNLMLIDKKAVHAIDTSWHKIEDINFRRTMFTYAELKLKLKELEKENGN